MNPIMSMVSAMHGLGTGAGKVGGMVKEVRMLYGTKIKDGEQILFYERLKNLAEHWKQSGDLDFEFTLFETGTSLSPRESAQSDRGAAVKHESRRISHADLLKAIGPEDDRENTVVYICGPPQLTDDFVALLQNTPGMEERRVLCEKWW